MKIYKICKNQISKNLLKKTRKYCRYMRTANLLTGKTEASEEEQRKAQSGILAEVLSHWHPNLTVTAHRSMIV